MLIAVKYGYSYPWILYGIGEKKIKNDNALVEKLRIELNLNDKAVAVLENFLSLSQEKQEALYDFISLFFRKFNQRKRSRLLTCFFLNVSLQNCTY